MHPCTHAIRGGCSMRGGAPNEGGRLVAGGMAYGLNPSGGFGGERGIHPEGGPVFSSRLPLPHRAASSKLPLPQLQSIEASQLSAWDPPVGCWCSCRTMQVAAAQEAIALWWPGRLLSLG